jgi:hypothetical protein
MDNTTPIDWQYRTISCCLVAVCCLLVIGCGPGHPETATVTGKVTFRGETVPAGKIMFYPQTGRAAVGTIEADGTYVLTTFNPGDGAVLGKHQVTITASKVTGGPPQPKTFKDELKLAQKKPAGAATSPKIVWLVPKQYSQRNTSPLTAEVKRGVNTIDFPLPRK